MIVNSIEDFKQECVDNPSAFAKTYGIRLEDEYDTQDDLYDVIGSILDEDEGYLTAFQNRDKEYLANIRTYVNQTVLYLLNILKKG